MNLSDPHELATLLEGILLAAGKPLSLERLAELFDEAERPEPGQFRDALAILALSCAGRSFELKKSRPGIACRFASVSRRGSAASGRSVRSAIRARCWKPWC